MESRHNDADVTNSENTVSFDRCQFAKTCNGGDGILFPSLFCSEETTTATTSVLGVDNHTRGNGRRIQNMLQSISRILLIVILALVLLLLFRLLNSTTDEFFSPGLELFSLHLGLPPRFAGVVSFMLLFKQIFIHINEHHTSLTLSCFSLDMQDSTGIGEWSTGCSSNDECNASR